MIAVETLSFGQASWKSRDGTVHAAVGERTHERDPATFLVYTACGKHDVPANHAATARLDDGRLVAPEAINCAGCLGGESALKLPLPPKERPMPKGESRTPGPFFFDQMICRHREDESLQPIAIPSAPLTMPEVLWLVDLLNKGTHFEKMLEAIKAAGCICGVGIGDPRAHSHSKQCNELDAAQRAAEGKQPTEENHR